MCIQTVEGCKEVGIDSHAYVFSCCNFIVYRLTDSLTEYNDLRYNLALPITIAQLIAAGSDNAICSQFEALKVKFVITPIGYNNEALSIDQILGIMGKDRRFTFQHGIEGIAGITQMVRATAPIHPVAELVQYHLTSQNTPRTTKHHVGRSSPGL